MRGCWQAAHVACVAPPADAYADHGEPPRGLSEVVEVLEAKAGRREESAIQLVEVGDAAQTARAELRAAVGVFYEQLHEIEADVDVGEGDEGLPQPPLEHALAHPDGDGSVQQAEEAGEKTGGKNYLETRSFVPPD